MFNGGAKQARNLEDITPKFVVITSQKTGNPFLLNSLKVDENGNIDIQTLKSAIEDNSYESLTIGISKGIFNNEEEVISSFDNVISVNKALDRYKNILKSK
jgi:CRISPR-associated protein Cst2